MERFHLADADEIELHRLCIFEIAGQIRKGLLNDADVVYTQCIK